MIVDKTGYVGVVLAVLAALMVTNEYRSGQIKTTLLSVPQRVPALVSKATIIAAVSFVIGVVSSSIGFAIAPTILAGGGYSYPLDTADAIRLILGSGLYLATLSVIGIAVGSLIRNVVAAVLTTIVFLIIVPVIPQMFSEYAPENHPLLPDRVGVAPAGTARNRRDGALGRLSRTLGLDRRPVHRRRDRAQTPGRMTAFGRRPELRAAAPTPQKEQHAGRMLEKMRWFTSHPFVVDVLMVIAAVALQVLAFALAGAGSALARCPDRRRLIRTAVLASPGTPPRALRDRVRRCRRRMDPSGHRGAELPVRVRALHRRRDSPLSARCPRVRDRRLPSCAECLGALPDERGGVLTAVPRPARSRRAVAGAGREEPAGNVRSHTRRSWNSGWRTRGSANGTGSPPRCTTSSPHSISIMIAPRGRRIDRVAEASRPFRNGAAEPERRRKNRAQRHAPHPPPAPR